MSILRLQHIGTSISDFDATRRALGELGFSSRDFRNDQGKGFQYDCRVLLGNECWLHIVQNWNPASRVATFLARRGQTLEHIAIQSDDIESDVDHLRSLGVPLFEDTIFDANDGFEAFVYPDDGIGFTVELIQPHEHSWQYPADAHDKPVSALLGVRRASELVCRAVSPKSAAEKFVRLFRGVELEETQTATRLRFANDCAIRLQPVQADENIGLSCLVLETDSLEQDKHRLRELSHPFSETDSSLTFDADAALGLPIQIVRRTKS